MGASPLEIGRCRMEEIGAIAAIAKDAFRSPWSEGQFAAELANPLARVLVARVGPPPRPAPAGYVVYWLVAGEMHLQGIAVAAHHRRQRIAWRLLAEALGASRREGATRATLEVRRSNTAARKLYACLGFSCAGVRRGYYGESGEDALILWAELGEGPPAAGGSDRPWKPG